MNKRYETMVVDTWLGKFYSLMSFGEDEWQLVGYTEYTYLMPSEEQRETDFKERMAGQKVRAIFQRELPSLGGLNWAGWVTGAVIASSIWLTALYILT